MVQQEILDKNGWKDRKAWAFGLGLERLAMVKFAINDIRTFWSQDERFTKQFKSGNLDTVFKPYSKYPPCFKVRLRCVLLFIGGLRKDCLIFSTKMLHASR